MLPLLIAPITALLERLIPDPVKASEAKAEMMNIMVEANAKEIEAKSKVVIAEATGESKVQRNWRPHLMYLFMWILAFNYIIAPTIMMFGVEIPTLEIPSHMWGLLTVGVGGYIGSRGYEKTTRMKTDKDLFDAARSVNGFLTQEQVDRINNNNGS